MKQDGAEITNPYGESGKGAELLPARRHPHWPAHPGDSTGMPTLDTMCRARTREDSYQSSWWRARDSVGAKVSGRTAAAPSAG